MGQGTQEGTKKDFAAARLTARLKAIPANDRSLRRLTAPTAVAAVVEADAYGVGVAKLALGLAQAGCESFFVARVEEGVTLRKLAAKARTFVLDGAVPNCVPVLIPYGM